MILVKVLFKQTHPQASTVM